MDVLSGFYKNFFSEQNFAKVVAGRFAITNKIDTGEILEALELASKLGKNYFEIVDLETMDVLRTCVTIFACPTCKISYKRPRPALFSFNSPIGACDACKGFENNRT